MQIVIASKKEKIKTKYLCDKLARFQILRPPTASAARRLSGRVLGLLAKRRAPGWTDFFPLNCGWPKRTTVELLIQLPIKESLWLSATSVEWYTRIMGTD